MTEFVNPFDDLVPKDKQSGLFDDLLSGVDAKAPLDLTAPVGSEGVIGGVADFGRGVARGVISGVPTQVGKAAEFFGEEKLGKTLQDFGARQAAVPYGFRT